MAPVMNTITASRRPFPGRTIFRTAWIGSSSTGRRTVVSNARSPGAWNTGPAFAPSARTVTSDHDRTRPGLGVAGRAFRDGPLRLMPGHGRLTEWTHGAKSPA